MRLATTIAMDPPWAERGGGKSKRGADKHYPLVATDVMPTIIASSPLWTPDRAGCSVWCWSTVNFLTDALWVLKALGATYVTNVVWLKGNSFDVCTNFPMKGQPMKGQPMLVRHVHEFNPPGLGQRLRLQHEHLLFARIGTVPVPKPADRLPSVVVADRAKHSEKPQEAYNLIERHDPPGVRHELFARAVRPGWSTWGHEIEGGVAHG